MCLSILHSQREGAFELISLLIKSRVFLLLKKVNVLTAQSGLHEDSPAEPLCCLTFLLCTSQAVQDQCSSDGLSAVLLVHIFQ